MKSLSAFKISLCFLPVLLACRSEEFFSKNQLEMDVTLKIINAYLEKDYLPPKENSSCHRSADFIKVNDTLVWRNYLIEKTIQEDLNQFKVQLSQDPVLLSKSYSNFPNFFQNRVELVNVIDNDDWCGIYSFSPAYKTANANEYIIQITCNSYEQDFGCVLLIEFLNNSYRIKEELDGWLTFF